MGNLFSNNVPFTNAVIEHQGEIINNPGTTFEEINSWYGSNTIHQLNVSDKYYRMLVSGQKRVEGRTFTEKRRLYKVGDLIEVTNQNFPSEKKVFIIRDLILASTFRELIEKVGIGNILPGVETAEQGVAVYHSIPDYPVEEHKYGVVGIELVKKL